MNTKIYHGSLQVVKAPQILSPNRTLDYGAGFYTTTSFEQARDWALRHKRDKNTPPEGYVNLYNVDLDFIRNSNTLWFDAPSEEWVDFVYANRNNLSFHHDYDYVYGPVANDKVYAAFTLYESGLLDKSELIRELKTYTLVDQLLFHTTKALNNLSFIEAIPIPFQ
ncbi:MAG: DUF3990 domain-containing protein [Bacteroidia bacterium]|nr:DUF3990 domain-containing protein [Bacteroidia bacterium]